jgi:hypothetical protein
MNRTRRVVYTELALARRGANGVPDFEPTSDAGFEKEGFEALKAD